MALNSFFETWLQIGAINTTHTETTVHNFPPSRVWSRPLLQRYVNVDDNASADAFVTRTTANGTNDSNNRAGVVVNNCTQVMFRVRVKNALARYACITIFF